MNERIPAEARDAVLDDFLRWYVANRGWDHSWRARALRHRQVVGVTLATVTSFLALAFGGWLCLPLDTFSSSTSFAAMRFLPEWWWGLAMGTAAVVSLVSLARGYRLARAASSWAKGFLFLTISISAGQATGWRSTGVPVYCAIALLTLAAYLLAPPAWRERPRA